MGVGVRENQQKTPTSNILVKGKSMAVFRLSRLTLLVLFPIVLLSSQVEAGVHQTPVTPIRHVIIIIGENHSFDNMFGGFVPAKNQFVWNLLSEKIIRPDGSPGPNASLARQMEATDVDRYRIGPKTLGPYPYLPGPSGEKTGGWGGRKQDPRFPNKLPNAPFPITRYVPYRNSIVGSPVHRFFQMWQQIDKGHMDLFPWVATTTGDGSDGKAPPFPFVSGTTGQGSVSMGFYNMGEGDEPVFARLSRTYALADNYHQTVMGGTGANHIAIGTADMAYYIQSGHPAPPPAGQIENPNPQEGGLNSPAGKSEGNYYTNDGYGNRSNRMGGNYVACADLQQPGVRSIRNYLSHLPYRVFDAGGPANCAPNTYYLVNNYDPAYDSRGRKLSLSKNPFLVSPQSLPTIADSLAARGISWGYFGQGWNHGNPTRDYCPHCNPFQFESSIMRTALRKNLRGYRDFVLEIKKGTLPSVSFLKPGNSQNGHPGYSSLSIFEQFVKKTVSLVQRHPEIWKNTAIFITLDEGGGYYDSGYVQPLSFFGDGTRVPLIVVSPFARRGFVDHTYYDHVSLIKFIEKNWHLGPLSGRSLDNLPDPAMPPFPAHPDLSRPEKLRSFYIPRNRPAIGDLSNLFDFSKNRTPPSLP